MIIEIAGQDKKELVISLSVNKTQATGEHHFVGCRSDNDGVNFIICSVSTSGVVRLNPAGILQLGFSVDK